MKQKLPFRQRLLFLLLPLLLSFGVQAQIQRESFEVAPGATGSQVEVASTTTYTVAATGNNSQYFVRASNATLSTVAPGFSPTTGVSGGTLDGSFYWVGEGVRGPASVNPGDGLIRTPGIVTLIPANVAGFGNLKVTVGFLDGRNSGTNWENDDTLKVQVRFNGGLWKTVGQFVGDNPTNGLGGRLRQDTNLDGKSYDAADASSPFITSPMSNFTFNVTGSGSTLQTRIVASENGLSEEFAFDNITLTGTASSNQAPVLANIEGTNLIYNEGDPAKVITSTLTVTDADNTTLTSATVKITTNFDATEDVLGFVNQNGITGTYTTNTGVLALTGTASLAAYQAALRSVTYRNSDAAAASGRPRVIEFSVTDAAAVAGTSTPVSRTITVNSALNAAVTLPFTEDFTTDNGIDKGEGLTYASNTFTDASGLKFVRTNVTPNTTLSNTTTFTNISNGFYFYGAGVSATANPDTRQIGELITQQVNTNGFKDIVLSLRLGAAPNKFDYQDYARISYRIGTGAWVTIGSFRSSNQTANIGVESSLRQDVDPNNLSSAPAGAIILGSALQTVTFTLPAAANNALVDFKVELRGDAGDEEFAFDLIQVTGTPVTAPVVTTTSPATSISTTGATLSGNVTSDGGATVTARGVVYSATNNTPTIGGTGVTQDANASGGTGAFSQVITTLTPGTTYYFRAYATNSVGTSYGSVVNFTTTPNAPVVTAPANGSLVNVTTPAYTGTALAGSTVTVIVDGSSIGTTTATAGGAFTLTQPTALIQGSHTVRATATIGTSAASASSNTNTFTVDSVNPGVAISSQGNTNGGNTTTSPIPFTVTFTENVTGFVQGDLTVTGGTISGFSASSGSIYTFNVTPAGNGTVTVNVPANVAVDQANNGNTAAPQFTVNYSAPAVTVQSVTGLTPSPTATATVTYQVTFSGTVSGLTTGNFNLTTSGFFTAPSLSSVSGSGTTYTVVVNTGAGDGTLRLNVNNSAGVTPTISNVPYTSGATYTITKGFAAAPTLRIQAAGSASGNSDVTAFVDVVKALQSGTNTEVPNGVQNGSFENNNVTQNNYLYQSQGVVASPWTFGPQAGITRNNSDFISFAADGDAVAFLQSAAGNNGSVSQNLSVPTGSYQVSFRTIQRNYTSLDQRLNVFINDVFVGNIQPNSSPVYETFTSASFTVVAPTLTATITSPGNTNGGSTGTSPIPFTVTFSANVTGFTAADVTVSNGTLSGFSGSGATYTFNVTPSANGTVTVNVPANSAVDSNNTNNTAAPQFSLIYTQPVTTAPVVTAPANGSLTNTTTPTYGGTALVGATIQVYVDGLPLASTTTANGAGNWAITQPTALIQGSHTVYATAQLSGQAVSANSNTNTFTVDSVRPGASITSLGNTNGGTTTTSPIPFTVTFTESVTGFVAGDVSVSNGSITAGSFSGSGTTYTFTVTPTSAFIATTVSVPANVAQDLALNGNTAASPFTVTFQAPTISLTPATLPNGTQGTAYSQVLTASGGAAPYTFAVTAGALPNGLSLVNGTLSGTPTANGTFNFTVTAIDNSTAPGPYSGSRNYTLVISTQPVTAAPVVTAPANGSLTNNPQPTYSGTAPAGSTVTVYVGLASGTATAIGTTTATGGTFSLIQPTNLASDTYQVYATAQTSGSAVSANSNTNTFTVDTQAPSVVIAGPVGSTSTSPIPVTVTFSENVTGFVQGDLTVTNGNISGFTAVDGKTYTFNVTPLANGSVTVSVPANVAQDLAGNGNTAATQYAVTYTAIVTATTWTGNVSTDWFTAGNWSAGIPTTTIDATIPVVGTRYPVITASTGFVRNLTLNNGATLTQTAGTLSVTANLTNNGTFNATGGTVVLASTTAANIVGSSTTRFWNLTVQPNGLTLATSAGASVQRQLLLNGNFATNANAFTLESNSTATAMVVNNPGVVTGTVTMQRYIDPSLNAGLGYRHYSSPVQSTTVADLATSGFTPVVNSLYNSQGNTVNPFPTVFGYDESRITGASSTTQTFEQGYFSPTSLGSPLTVGRGYTVNLSASEKVDLNGTLNNGTVAVGALSRGTEANSGWQLLGNPYPSPLDWNAARGSLPTGVQDAIYVYKSSDQYDGTYQFYQNGFGTLPGGLVPSMQGFFLRVTQPVASFNFLNAWRSTTYQNPTFNRTTADTRPSVQLDLVSAQGTHEPAYVYFEAGATAGIDGHYDAEKLPNTTGLNLSSVAAGTGLAVNGLPLQNTPTTVPLTVGVPTTGSYTLTAAALLNLATTDVFLHDAVTGQQINLKQQASYSFSASNAALIAGRFTLNFGPMRPTATKAGLTAASVSLYPNPAHKSFTLLVPAVSGESQAQLTLYNVLGQPVREATLALPAAGAQTTMDVQDLPLGVYMLRVKAGATTVTKQVVVN